MNSQWSRWQVCCRHRTTFSLACCRLFLLFFLLVEIIRALSFLCFSFIPTSPMNIPSTLCGNKDVDLRVTARALPSFSSMPCSSLFLSSSFLSSLSLFSASSTSSRPFPFFVKTFLLPFAEAVSTSKVIILTYSFTSMGSMESSCFINTPEDTYPTETTGNTVQSFKKGGKALRADAAQGFSTSYNALLKEPLQPCIFQPYLNHYYVFPIYSFGIVHGGNISVTVTDTNIQDYAYADFLSNFMSFTSSEGAQIYRENSVSVPDPAHFSSSPSPPPSSTIPRTPSTSQENVSLAPSFTLVRNTSGGTGNEGGGDSDGGNATGRPTVRDYLPKIRVLPASTEDKILLLASSRSFRQFRAPFLESYIPAPNHSNTSSNSSFSTSSLTTSAIPPAYLQQNLFYPWMNLANQCTLDYTQAESSVLLKIFSQTTWNALFTSRFSTNKDWDSSGGSFFSWVSFGRHTVPVMSLCNAPSLYTIPLVGPSFLDLDTVIQYDYYLERLVLVVIQCSPIPVEFNLQITLQNVGGQGSSIAYLCYIVLLACLVYYLALILVCVGAVVYKRQQLLLGRHYILQMQGMVKEETRIQRERLRALDNEGQTVPYASRATKPSDASYYYDNTTDDKSSSSRSSSSSSSGSGRRRRRIKGKNVRKGCSLSSNLGSFTPHSLNSSFFTHDSRSPLSRRKVADRSKLHLSMENEESRVKGKQNNSNFVVSSPLTFSSSPSWRQEQPAPSSGRHGTKEAGEHVRNGGEKSHHLRKKAKKKRNICDEEPINESDNEGGVDSLIYQQMEEEEEVMTRGSRKQWDSPTRRERNESTNRMKRRRTESEDFSFHLSSWSSASSFHTSQGQQPSSSVFSSMEIKHGKRNFYTTGTTTSAFTNTNPNSLSFFFHYCIASMKEYLLFSKKKEIGASLMAMPHVRRCVYHPLRWLLFTLLPLKVLSIFLTTIMYGLSSSAVASNSIFTLLSFFFRGLVDEGVIGLQLVMAVGWGLAVERVSFLRTSLICIFLILNIILFCSSYSCEEVNVFVWRSLPPEIPMHCAIAPVGKIFLSLIICAACIIELHILHTRITYRAWTNREYPIFIQKPSPLSTTPCSRSSSAAASTPSSPPSVSPSLFSSYSSFLRSPKAHRRAVSESREILQKEKSEVANQPMRRFYYLNETPLPSPSSLYDQESQRKKNMANIEEEGDHKTAQAHFQHVHAPNWVSSLRLPPFPACPPLSSLWGEIKGKNVEKERRWRRTGREKGRRSYSRRQYEEKEDEEEDGKGGEGTKLTRREKKKKMEERVCEAHQLILSQATKAYRLALSHHWQSLRAIYHTAFWVYIFVLFWPIAFLICSFYLYDSGDYYMVFLFQELHSIHLLTFAVYFLAF